MRAVRVRVYARECERTREEARAHTYTHEDGQVATDQRKIHEQGEALLL